MEGVSWLDRQPSDWLASNGRWYPARNYPNGWSSSALPPAPGHGGANSTLQKYARAAAEAAGLGGADQRPPIRETPTPTPPSYGANTNSPSGTKPPPAPSAGSTPGFSVARSGRSVADATVTSQKTYANSVGPAAPPPPAIAPPAPPGRVRSDAPMASSGSVPAQRTEFPSSPAPRSAPPAPVRHEPTEGKSEIEVIAGDLGTVLGSAKRRIEKALNDNFEGN